MSDILLLHGPNLNTLGTREPGIYGHDTLEEINARARQQASEAGASLSDLQSNHEGDLVDRVQQALHDGTRFIVINPAAFTHTSVALRDAFAAVKLPSSRCISQTYMPENPSDDNRFSPISPRRSFAVLEPRDTP